jgi:hypothetical protein
MAAQANTASARIKDATAPQRAIMPPGAATPDGQPDRGRAQPFRASPAAFISHAPYATKGAKVSVRD